MNEFLQIFTAIDIKYTISTCLLSYLIIEASKNLLNKIPKGIKRTWTKRGITIICGILLSILYIKLEILEIDLIIPSFLLSVVLYDYLIKILINRISIKRQNAINTKSGNSK